MNYIDHYVDRSDQSIAAGVSDELSWHAEIDSEKTDGLWMPDVRSFLKSVKR